MIEITANPIDPDIVINGTRSAGSGCVATYVGLIRDNSHGKPVASVEYSDKDGRAVDGLKMIARTAAELWEVENISIVHRTGLLKPGDINLTVCVAAAHRREGFAACEYIIDRFKENLPTQKLETYADWQKENNTGVIYYLEDGFVCGVMLCNVWEKVDAARELIKSNHKITPDKIGTQLHGAI